MEPIRVIPPRDTPWRVYTIGILLLVGGPLISLEAMRHWPRVAPGEPASEPNSWIAAKSDSRMQAAAAFKPIHDVQVVSDAQPRSSLIGMRVELTRCGVTALAGANGFWITQVRTPAVFVAFARSAPRTQVHPGEHVEVRGTVRPAPDPAAIASRWPELRGSDRDRLLEQRVYIEADEVTTHGEF